MASRAQDSVADLERAAAAAKAPRVGAQRSPFLEAAPQEHDSVADLEATAKPEYASRGDAMYSGYKKIAANIDRGFTKFSEDFLIRKPGQYGASRKIGDAVGKQSGSFWEGYKRDVSLSFPGISGAAPPSFDEMENVAAGDEKFAQVWAGLKTELMASEERAAVIDSKEYEQNKLLVAYEQYQKSQDTVSKENKGLSFERFSALVNHIGVPTTSATAPGMYFGDDVEQPSMPYDELKPFKDHEIPGFTRPPLTKEEISAAAYEFMRSGSEEDLNKLPYVVRKVVSGLAAGTRMAVELVPVGRAARALGAVGTAAAPFLEGAAMSAADQALAIESGAQTEPFSVGDMAAQAMLMKAGSVAGKALAAKVPGGPKSSPMVAKAAAMTGMVGTIEAGNAALNFAKTGKLPFEGSEDIGKDILGAIIEGGVAILTASKLGGGKSAELSPSELATAKSQRALLDADLYRKSRDTGMSIEDSVRKALPKVFAEKDRVLKANELKIQDEFIERQVRVLELGRDFDEYLDKYAGKDPGDRKELTFDLRRALEAAADGEPVGVESRLATGDAFAEGLRKLKALGGEEGGLAAGRAQRDQGIIPEGRYRRELPQTGDPALRKQTDEALLQAASRGGTKPAVDDTYAVQGDAAGGTGSAARRGSAKEAGALVDASDADLVASVLAARRSGSSESAAIDELVSRASSRPPSYVESLYSIMDDVLGERSFKSADAAAEKVRDEIASAVETRSDKRSSGKPDEMRDASEGDLVKGIESGDQASAQELLRRIKSRSGNPAYVDRLRSMSSDVGVEATIDAALRGAGSVRLGEGAQFIERGQLSRELRELERRLVQASNPQEYAAELLRKAEALGDDAFVQDVQGAIDRAMPKAGNSRKTADEDVGKNDLVIHKHEFDQGFTDAKPDRMSEPVSRQAADAGDYGKLVGGYKWNEKRGFYFKIDVIGPLAPVPVEPGERGPRQPQQTKAPLGSAQVRGSTMRRTTETFEDAVAKHNLDITHTKAMDLFLDQFEASKRMMSLEIGRESGHVLKPEELPNVEARAEAAAEIVERSNRIKALQQGFRDMTVAEKAQARDQILADNIAIKRLRKIQKSEFFKLAESRDPKAPEWGIYEGYFIHPELHAKFLDAPGPRSSGQYIHDAIVNKLKFARVGGSFRQIAGDVVGNAIKWATGGVASWRHLPRAIGVEMGKVRRDRIDMLFDVLARKTALGGSADMTTQELNRTAKIDSEIAQAERQGRSGDVKKLGIARTIDSGADRVMSGIEARRGALGKVSTSPGRFTQKLGRGRIKLDRASSRSAFRELMENGVDGSGPLSASEAFEIVKRGDDYGTLHKGIQEFAKWFHMLRFPSKVLQATMAQMEKRPSIFGQAIPTPMDTVIRRAPGSGPAKAALVTRGIMRLATSVAQIAWIPMAAQKTMMEQLGISQKKLDEHIDETYGWMPPHARFLTKLMFVPTGKSKLGGIEGFDASSYMPQAPMLRYFWTNFSNDGGDWGTRLVQDVVSRMIDVAPIAQGLTGKRFTLGPAPEGAGPGDRWYPAMTMLAPAFMVDSLNEWFQQNNVPESERSAVRGVLKSVVGVPMTVLRNKSFVKTMLDDFNERGIVEKVIGEDTASWFYRVKNPETQSGIAAQQIIDYAEKMQPDLFSFQMKQQRKMDQIKEAVGGKR